MASPVPAYHELSLVDEPGALDGLALACVPALRGDIAWQHSLLELGSQLVRRTGAPRRDALGEQALPPVDEHQHRQVVSRQLLGVPCRRLHVPAQLEPVEAIAREREEVRQVADWRERCAAELLDGHGALVRGEIQLHRLGGARQVRDAENDVFAVLTQVHEHLAVARADESQRAASEGLRILSHQEHALHPVEQRRAVALLRFDVHGLVAVDGIHHRRQVQLLRIGPREAGVAVRAPLHGRAHAVAVAEVHVVAHADLVAVVDDRRAGHGQQQAVHQLDALGIVLHERREPPADAEVQAGARVRGVHLVHVVALAARHHLEGQLVVVAQEDGPLRAVGDVRRLLHDLDDGVAVLLRDGHVHARHQREVVCHVAFVAVLAEVVAHVLRPHVGFAEQHAARVVSVDDAADAFDHLVRLPQVLVARALALHEIRDGVEPQTVDALVEPEAHHLGDGALDVRVVEVEVRLVAEEAVPVVGPGKGIERPVGRFGVGEDDARARVLRRVVAPHVVVALARARRSAPRRLEPRMLVRGMVDDQLGDDAQAAAVRLVDELFEVLARAVGGVDLAVVGDVVPVVLAWRGVERQQPDGVDAEVLDVVQLLDDAAEVADAVVVAVVERADVQLVDDRVLVPVRIHPRRPLAVAHARALLLIGP